MSPRYRFAEFTLSPRRRLLLRDGRETRLIPRYFDLLVFLVERRHDAVHRRDIFDRVWRDVVVSDSALSQAIRTLRRTLGDDSREPQFIRTVARHGYRFVFPQVVEENDDDSWPVIFEGGIPSAVGPADADSSRGADRDPFEPLLQRMTTRASSADDEEDQREAAERLHALGTTEALKRLGTRSGHSYARALLRDTRWDAAGAADVPLFGQPGSIAAAAALVALRLRRAARLAAARGVGAALGSGAAGALGGAVGGLMLAAAPSSQAPVAVAAVLAVIGTGCGALGGAGVGAGLSMAEAAVRSRRTLAVTIGGALGGALVGSAAQWLGRWTLSTLVGVHVPVGGGLDGLVLGGAAGFGYALATHRFEGGLASPRGRHRIAAAAWTSGACALGALMLATSGRSLVGGTIHAVAQASTGSQAVLTPLGRLIGDPDFGRVTRAVIGTGEGALFGLGLALGLTRRPNHGGHVPAWRSRTSHQLLTNR